MVVSGVREVRSLDLLEIGMLQWEHIRSNIGVKEDVSLFQILRVRTVLEILLQRVAPFNGRNGGSINVGGLSHDW